MGINKLAILRPVRLRLEKPLEGPYTRILRRPVPEAQALGSGETIAIVRALCITEPIPLYASRIASYYPLHKKGGGLRAEDFRNVDWADDILATWLENEDNSLSYLVVPVGHIRYPIHKTWTGFGLKAICGRKMRATCSGSEARRRTHTLAVLYFLPVPFKNIL